MDTRFWGPSGWRLLHSITFTYKPTTDKAAMRTMFEMLPFVLPCKFCRASLQEYIELDPIDTALDSVDSLSRWLWRIHNMVNKKLRDQNISVEPDPSYEKVKEFYTKLLQTGCSQTEFPGWDFLFSIANLHPRSKAARKSIPMPGAPCKDLMPETEKNKWNCLEAEERVPFYIKFWQSLGRVLPFDEWRKSWKTHLDVDYVTMNILWKVRCSMENDLTLLNRCKYSSLCKTIKTHRSDCSKSRRARTCRKKRNTK